MQKIIIILSGGVDSTTLLYDFLEQGYDVKALSFFYGQKHVRELLFAKETCKKLNVPHQVTDISSITGLISNSALIGDAEIPEGDYTKERLQKTYVPARNMIMLSIAAGYADNISYEYIGIANHAGDHELYPDCRPYFIKQMDEAIYTGTLSHVCITAPYTNLSKINIVEKGIKLGIDYDNETYSCYNGEIDHCRKCSTCLERFESLTLGGYYAKKNN